MHISLRHRADMFTEWVVQFDKVTQVGETPWIVLNTNMEILKMILCSIGSQCSCLRKGVMWVNFLESVTSLAAVFCNCWSRRSCVLLRLCSSELHVSSSELMRAWVNGSITSWYAFKSFQYLDKLVWSVASLSNTDLHDWPLSSLFKTSIRSSNLNIFRFRLAMITFLTATAQFNARRGSGFL